MLRKTMLALGASLALLTPAFAGPLMQSQSVRVEYADLNLNSPAGAQTLLRRIRHASHRVCGDAHGRPDLQERRQVRACLAAALRDAVRDLNQPLLTELYQQRYARDADETFAAAP